MDDRAARGPGRRESPVWRHRRARFASNFNQEGVMPNFDSVVVRSFAKCLGWARRSFGGKQARRAASRPALVAAAAAAVETLENRQLMSVSMVNGWTEIKP